jgi:hypothetical protein
MTIRDSRIGQFFLSDTRCSFGRGSINAANKPFLPTGNWYFTDMWLLLSSTAVAAQKYYNYKSTSSK